MKFTPIAKSLHALIGLASVSAVAALSGCLATPHHGDHARYHASGEAVTAGSSITTLPRGYTTFTVDGGTYYYHGGKYYRRHGSNYVTTTRPLRYPRRTVNYDYNVVHSTLPRNYQRLRFRDRDYYFNDGIFYEPRGSTYVTVRDPFRY